MAGTGDARRLMREIERRGREDRAAGLDRDVLDGPADPADREAAERLLAELGAPAWLLDADPPDLIEAQIAALEADALVIPDDWEVDDGEPSPEETNDA